MQDLYTRLKEHGFDRKFLQNAVLPDWWEDSLAAQPANRAMAEMAVARQLGFKIAHLRDPSHKLPAPSVDNFRLKRKKDTTTAELKPALLVAQRLSKIVIPLLKDVSPYKGPVEAEKIRMRILADGSRVDLAALLRFAWSCGIAVIHLQPARLPKASKRFEGLAMFCDTGPIIVLASGNDSPPWLAFHLAHELGHIMLGHVKPGDSALVDSNINLVDDDAQEREADAFANRVLSGQEKPGFNPAYGLNAARLANAAIAWGRQNGVDPGTVALIYGRSANRWGPAQLALKRLKADRGAHRIISQCLWEHLDQAEVPESSERFMSCLSPDDPLL